MKRLILKILLALVIGNLSFVIAQGQTWKERMDSTNKYRDLQDYSKALEWAEKNMDIVNNEFPEKDTVRILAIRLLADIWGEMGNYFKSLELFKIDSTLTYELFGDNHLHTAHVLYYLSITYQALGNIDMAKKHGLMANEIFKLKLGTKNPDYSQSINNIATIYLYDGILDSAYYYIKECIDIRKEIYGEESKEYAISIHNLSLILRKMGRTNEALPFSERAVEILKRIVGENNIDYSIDLSNLATIYEELGQYDKAEKGHRDVVRIIGKILGEEHYDFAYALNSLGLFCGYIGKYSEAEKYLKRAIDIYMQSTGESREYAFANHNLSMTYNNLGKLELAEYHSKKACEILKRIVGEDNIDYAIDLSNLATIYENMGRYEESESCLMKVYEIISKSGQKGTYFAYILNQISHFYSITWRYETALQYINQALEIYESITGKKNLRYAYSLHHKAMALRGLGRLEEAIENSQQAIDIIKSLIGENNINYAIDLSSHAINLQNSGYFDNAEESFKKASDITGLILGYESLFYGNTLNDLSVFYNFTARFDKGLEFAKKSNSIILDFIQNIYPYLSENEKQKVFQKVSYPIEMLYTYLTHPITCSRDLLDELLNTRLVTKAMLMNASIRIKSRIMASGDTTLIQKFDRWNNLREQIYKIFTSEKNSLFQKSLNLDSLVNQANLLEKEISINSKDFATEYDRSSIHWTDIKNVLQKDEAAIEIIRFRKLSRVKYTGSNDIFVPSLTDTIHYAVFIIKPKAAHGGKESEVEMILLRNGNELEGKLIELYRKQIDQQKKSIYDPERIKENLEFLYNEFWEPIQQIIKGYHKIFLSLDGVYNQINLNTLINPKTGKYLLDELDLRIVTSTRDLVERNPRQSFALTPLLRKGEISNTAELFGDPQFNLDSAKYTELAIRYVADRSRDYHYIGNTLDSATRQGISPLPGTRNEIEKIANYMKDKNWIVNTHLGAAALEEAIKSVNSPRVLHIASHGKFLKDVETKEERSFGMETQRFVENPLLRSMLLFSGAENTILETRGSNPFHSLYEDGLLTAYEAQNLNLDNTELVVLSACETGLGEVRNGEGVYGLQRAFQVAGAKSLIMSLWSVSDQATQELMTGFYEKWLSGKTKREAFREAQMELKQKYPGFYYWGAFVMVGE